MLIADNRLLPGAFVGTCWETQNVVDLSEFADISTHEDLLTFYQASRAPSSSRRAGVGREMNYLVSITQDLDLLKLHAV